MRTLLARVVLVVPEVLEVVVVVVVVVAVVVRLRLRLLLLLLLVPVVLLALDSSTPRVFRVLWVVVLKLEVSQESPKNPEQSVKIGLRIGP